MTTHNEEAGGTVEGRVIGMPTGRRIGAVAMIGTIVVGETTPETVLVIAEMAHLTPGLAAGVMIAVNGASPPTTPR